MIALIWTYIAVALALILFGFMGYVQGYRDGREDARLRRKIK